MTYLEKLQDPRWQRKRLEVMSRDKFTCVDCDSTEKPLQVHHCFYQRGNPWDTDNILLMTLCEECHKERQAIEDRIKLAMGVLFSKMHPVQLEFLADSIEGHNGIGFPVLTEQQFGTEATHQYEDTEALL